MCFSEMKKINLKTWKKENGKRKAPEKINFLEKYSGKNEYK